MRLFACVDLATGLHMLYTKSALEAHADKAAIETAWDPLKPGFYFLTRAAVLDLTATQLQRMQEMRDSKLLVKVLIDLNDAFRGKGLIESVLFVSHRWEDPATPDETGAQLAAIKAHLLAHPEIQFVWFDYSCMPQRSSGLSPDQDDRTPAEKAEFDLMLKAIADLYLTAKVLILLDTMYRTRFWTTMEGWCAMQQVTPQGVRPARAGESRVTVVCIHNATHKDREALLEMSTKTPAEMSKFLASPDVAVTNKKDKTTMLPIVGKTDEHVREMMSGMQITIPESHETELREDDNPISLSGITPLVMEREGATTGNADASELPVRASSASEPLYQGFHPGISCHRSGMNPIVGMCFHLRGSEPSSDLCQAEYDKLDDAEKGLYEAIPPPPPGLKLEGGSLTGEAAKYPGTYCLDGSKLVNGRPAYQHTRDATRWIAFAGNGWIGQLESSLGEKKGYLNLRDPAAASPDVSTMMWIVRGGAGSAWVEAPQLKCTAWTPPPPPPPGLKLEGGSLEGDAAEYIGGYRLVVGKLVNGRPAYQHVADGSRWLAFDGAIWRGQPEADLGQKRGVLQLPDEAAATPNASAAPWLCGWAPQPQLKCIPWTPPPLSPGLKLEGGSLPGAAAEYMGGYRLDCSKLVNGRPAYQHMAHFRCWIAFDGAIWRGQPEADLGQKRGYLQLLDAAALTPDASAATWLAETGSGLAAQPQLKCIPCAPPPPPGLKLEGGSLPGAAAEYMGGYSLFSGKLVNGRPAWRHTAHFTCWLAFDGAIWRGQPEADLGKKRGVLKLPDAAALTPDASAATWLAETGSGWVEAPQLKCIPCTPPPPPGLKLDGGGSLPGDAAEYMGGYRLDGSKLVNGRPVYQHVADGSRWLAFDGAIWRGQPEADVGQKRGVLKLPDAAALTPDASAATWLAETGSGWAAQPQLKCIPCTPPPPPGLKLDGGGSLEGAAAEYMGVYRLDRSKLVNGRPAYQQVTLRSSWAADGSRWLAFDGAIWRGQPEADLGQDRGFLKLPDAAALTPDASAATWLTETGSGLAALKCIPCTPPPPPGLKLEGGSLPGDAAEYMGEYRLDGSKLVNGRPVYQHVADGSRWLAFDGASWRGQPEADLGQDRGFLKLPDAAALTPDASAATWLTETGSGLAALKCIPCTPPPPPGLKLEGGSLPGDAVEYMGGYCLADGKLVNGRPAYQQMTLGSSWAADGSRWIAFNGKDSWMGQPQADLGKGEGKLWLLDAAAATPDVSSATWKAWTGATGSGWVEAPPLKCIPWTPSRPPPPPGLKLEGGSLEGAAAKYMGEYRLAVYDRAWPLQVTEAGCRGNHILVNGRPAWRHTTHLTCWLAFDGANWRGQPEASLGQKSGVLLLSDAAALSPDASSATWLAANGPGSAGAAQPQLKCIPCAAPPLSQVELEELPVKNFRGPCADCCKPLAPCCCVSADGEAIFGCVPTDREYHLPACLHMALCPQLGCDPRGGDEKMDYFIGPFITTLLTTSFVCCFQGKDHNIDFVL
jgi:hypothetical protein